jgi:hypothetical protein
MIMGNSGLDIKLKGDKVIEQIPSVKDKALRINLNENIYGTFAEIGAGQETVRHFFRAGGSSGTIAKAMSAYDKDFSDAIYGIEVAKESLTYEFDYLLKSEVNMCHCTLLSSVMTTEGIIMSVDRHGVNKTESGPLGRVTFEETVFSNSFANVLLPAIQRLSSKDVSTVMSAPASLTHCSMVLTL